MKDHFYKLKSYKKDGPLIAEIKVHKGQAILAFDKLNIFDNPFLSDNQPDNDWLRINFALNQESKAKIKKYKCVMEAQGFPFKSMEFPFVLNNTWKYYTHRLIGVSGDKFRVKVYG